MNEHTLNLWEFMVQQADKLAVQTLQHIGLTFIALILAVLIGLPLGIFITRKKQFSGAILGVASVLQTIPSIALLGFLIPVLGIGPKPAIFALFLYALLPIIRNTFTGITGVDPSVKEAAVATGMNKWQILFKVELPLAMPVIFAGIRTATVITVGVATLASYIAAGGLGEFIFGGISLNNTNMILAGAIPAALLAVIFNFLLSRLQKINVAKINSVTKVLPFLLLLLASLYFAPSAYGSKLKAGFTPEFMGRSDGNLGLIEKYGLKINTVVINDAVMYKAAYEKQLDVISGYSTDGRLAAFNLVILQDDRHIFPPYYAAPIIKQATLKKYPDLENTLNLLSGKINDSVMTRLNYLTDYLHQSPEQVAKDFLVANHLYKPSRRGHEGTIIIGSKIFGEQYILANMYALLIKGNTNYDVATKTGLGGTKICFEALNNNQIDFYPEYTGTGLLAILKPSVKTVVAVSVGKDITYNYVNTEFEKKYDIKWLKPIGFNNAYALMMRKNQANSLHIKTISELSTYLNQK